MATPEFSGARQVITLLPEAETSNHDVDHSMH